MLTHVEPPPGRCWPQSGHFGARRDEKTQINPSRPTPPATGRGDQPAELSGRQLLRSRVTGASRITANSAPCFSEQCRQPQMVMSGCPSRFGTQRRRTITRLQIRHRYGSRTVMAGLLWWPQRSICRAFDDGAVNWLTWKSRNLTAIWRLQAVPKLDGYTPTKSEPGPPMDLANMRENGVRSIAVYCLDCNRRADVDVDKYPAHWPAWHTKTAYIPPR